MVPVSARRRERRLVLPAGRQRQSRASERLRDGERVPHRVGRRRVRGGCAVRERSRQREKAALLADPERDVVKDAEPAGDADPSGYALPDSDGDGDSDADSVSELVGDRESVFQPRPQPVAESGPVGEHDDDGEHLG